MNIGQETARAPWGVSLPEISKLAETNQPVTLLIPEPEGEEFEAGEQRDGRHALEQRLRLVAPLQIVIGNLRAQMMNVMKPDVARKPLENPGQFVERAALQRRREIIPFLVPLPVNSFELMLHVKQPHPGRAGHHYDRQLDQQIRLEAENHAQPDGHSQNRQICPIHRVTLPPARLFRRKPVLDHKQEKRRHHEEHERISRQPIREPFPAGCFQIFLHGQCPYRTQAAPVQVASRRMVDGMFPAPEMIRGEGQYAGDEAPNIIGFPGLEKRTVAAIVVNDEQPHQKSPRQYRQRQRNPPGHRQAEVNQIPENGIRNERVDDLPDATPPGRLLISGHDLLPGRSVAWAFTGHQARDISGLVRVRSRRHQSRVGGLSSLEEPPHDRMLGG